MEKAYLELIDELNELRNTDKVLLSVGSTMQAEIKERIFERGQAADDGPIGQYSTKPISIARNKQARATRSTFFKGGYKEYKSAIGFDSSTVNLVDSGQMRDDFSLIKISNNVYGLGFKNDLNGEKAEGNEKRFGKDIFAHSPNEDRIFDEVFQFELDRIFGK
jgi:hypothetical protein